jgi:putative endonuclease
MYFCYILECADESLYVGVSDNPPRRLQEQNEGQGAQWTARRRPVRMVWMEEHETLSSARQLENQLKG